MAFLDWSATSNVNGFTLSATCYLWQHFAGQLILNGQVWEDQAVKETDEDSSRPAEPMEAGDGSPVEGSAAAMDGSPNDGVRDDHSEHSQDGVALTGLEPAAFEVEIQAAFPGRLSSADGGQQPAAAQDQDEGSVGHSACFGGKKSPELGWIWVGFLSPNVMIWVWVNTY